PHRCPTRSHVAGWRLAVVGVAVRASVLLIAVAFRSPTSGALHGVDSAGAPVLRPYEIGAERLARPFEDVYGYFSGLANAKSENKQLRSEVDQARQQVIQYQSAYQENIQLRKLLRYIDGPRFPTDYSPVAARIISRAPSDFDQQVVMSAGSGSGIRQDTPVVTNDGLGGRGTDLNAGAAQVTLITDDDSAVPALDQNSRALGLVRVGQGEGQLILDRVPKEMNVQQGDVIVTAGTRSKQYPSLYPRGIPIGYVVSVGQTDTAPYKSVQIQPYVDFGSL